MIRHAAALFFFGGILFAAPDMPSGIFRGRVEAVEGTAASGQLTARSRSGDLESCGYDGRTYIEMDKARVPATKLQPGDPIEIVADRRGGSIACYARVVHVVPPSPAKPTSVRRVEAPLRGDRTAAGIVVRTSGGVLTMRTRSGSQSFLLRPDTRYLDQGARVALEALRVNTHVSVRYGRNLQGELEAFQVVWGEMVDPR